ncbi:MAG: elongation factor P [Phycisphaeraceae bacterium]|nr:elongation factor P [Phycisphaeraceae bacterium]
MKAQDLRPGQAITHEGDLWLVTGCEHVKPGKGPAYAQLKLKNLNTGTNLEKRFRSVEEVEQAFLDRREMEFLYADTSEAVFMDKENYEQMSVPLDQLEGKIEYLTPNIEVICLMHAGNLVEVELPSSVDLEVTDTAPQPKGSTQTNQLKEATLSTGLDTRVPPFIEMGEVVRISTETGEYLGRADGS